MEKKFLEITGVLNDCTRCYADKKEVILKKETKNKEDFYFCQCSSCGYEAGRWFSSKAAYACWNQWNEKSFYDDLF